MDTMQRELIKRDMDDREKSSRREKMKEYMVKYKMKKRVEKEIAKSMEERSRLEEQLVAASAG